ncbi:MAG: ATP synthase F1 subunit delta [Candidatus Delongbacteria bacterium]|nr:ATP synthase F1 subunit delta [Candidatus Delongbacteria bacterium]MBN2836599.1 ATP synthase F1 subunit delta [Candidatus Delongbacteria bacterium]
MKDQKIVRKYAGALFSIGKEKNLCESFLDDLDLVSETIKNSELDSVFGNSKISPAQKKEIFKGVFEGNISPDIHILSNIIFDKGRQSILPFLFLDFKNMMDDDNGLVKVAVDLAVEANGKIKSEISDFLKKLGFEQTVISYSINRDLIAGFTVKVNDVVYDKSLKGKLENLRYNLLK